MRRVASVETSFQSFEVWQSAEAVELRVAGAVHAWYHRKRLLSGLAWDMIAASALLGVRHPPRSVLMLGLAGGTAFRVLRHLLPDCALTAVEIDPGIVEIARRHMGLDALGIEVISADAYAWLELNRRTFDVVIDDIYLAGRLDVFRPREWDGRLMNHLKRAIAPGGILAVNLVTGAGHRKMQSLTRRALRAAFPAVRSIRSAEAQNEVLVGGDRVAAASCLLPYRDCFDDWRDRMYWDRLKLNRVS